MDKHSRDPINGAMVTIISHAVYSTTERDGRFSIPAVPVGQYTIEATAIGYKTRQVEKLMISEVGSLEITVELEKAPIALAKLSLRRAFHIDAKNTYHPADAQTR